MLKHLLPFQICECEVASTIAPEEIVPRLGLGLWLGLILWLGAIVLELHMGYVKSFYQPVVKWKGKSISWAVVLVKKKF